MQKLGEKITSQELFCSHCGDKCINNKYSLDDKIFCCAGCQSVYSILSSNGLCDYYSIDSQPGSKQETRIFESKYEYLDDFSTITKLLDFSDGKTSSVTFNIPSIHCSSCIWLLEKLNRLDSGIIHSQVNFPKKKVIIKFNNTITSLKNVVILLAKIGYEPYLALDSTNEKSLVKKDNSLILKLGIAAFCFGNIMLLSFPEYLSSSGEVDQDFKNLFGYFIIILSLPVFFYSASDYFLSAYNGLKAKLLNIDVPLSIGIIVLFIRSLYEIFAYNDPGYMDSMTGLVFLLLIGKLVKHKTYDALNFERNYKSYFPLAVTIINNYIEKTIPLSNLKIGNRIVVRNNELIPADSVLIKGKANIDYSFVTGESAPVVKNSGDLIYAGGRQRGATLELEIVKDVSQSYLTQLWNRDTFTEEKNEAGISDVANLISKYFTPAILLIAIIGGIVWLGSGFDAALNVFTAVLIVACPCALAVSLPFTLGNSMRIFGRNRLYIKNPSVVENLSYVNTIVFDKTGTITKSNESSLNYNGSFLNAEDTAIIRSLAKNSQHPLSVILFNSLKSKYIYEVSNFTEETGKGLSGNILGRSVKIGSEEFVKGSTAEHNEAGSNVFISIDEDVKGYFTVNNNYRKGLNENIKNLNGYDIHLLTGDNKNEEMNLRSFFGNTPNLHFNMSVHDKLDYIISLQKQNKNVLMLGDGLNDAGALKQSNIGISVAEDINNFTPACDGILESGVFEKLNRLIVFSKDSMAVIKTSFVLSILYNIAGLGLALQGLLTPLFAAVLMPVSSITIVSFGVLATNFLAKKRGLS